MRGADAANGRKQAPEMPITRPLSLMAVAALVRSVPSGGNWRISDRSPPHSTAELVICGFM
jgi:hypothetical protein